MNIDTYTENVLTLCQAMAENEYTKSERKLRKFASFTRLSIVSRPLLINLKGFRATWSKTQKMQGWVINRYKPSTVAASGGVL